LRFVLDSDVDEGGCRRSLIAAGHEVLTARAAGVHDEDPDVTAYAVAKSAVVVTCDKEFTARHREHPEGRHVRLKCADPAAERVLAKALPVIVPILERYTLLTMTVSAVKVRVFYAPPNGGMQEIALDLV
jgi:predicted nuclease of predicted toxin-antitoxin system